MVTGLPRYKHISKEGFIYFIKNLYDESKVNVEDIAHTCPAAQYLQSVTGKDYVGCAFLSAALGPDGWNDTHELPKWIVPITSLTLGPWDKDTILEILDGGR